MLYLPDKEIYTGGREDRAYISAYIGFEDCWDLIYIWRIWEA